MMHTYLLGFMPPASVLILLPYTMMEARDPQSARAIAARRISDACAVATLLPPSSIAYLGHVSR